MRERGPIAVLAVLACSAVTGFSGCGGGEKKQDAAEPAGDFDVEVTTAEFPKQQKLAKNSSLLIRVKNTGDKALPNPALTVTGLDFRKDDPTLADPNRPVFVVNSIPTGSDTAFVGTYAFGKRLAPGKSATFRFRVTAVRPGPYRLTYKIAAGLNGKAKAIDEFGKRPSGTFLGSVSDAAPDSRIGPDGETVITDGEKEKKEPSPVQPSQDAELPPGESGRESSSGNTESP
ncbi:MAG: hypothetical protein H0T15_07570 [Thermoleophilaceae bacterium]|nr:hypothetical protein [Thermoleophilaceae bacterium]